MQSMPTEFRGRREASVNPALRGRCEAIRSLLATANADEARTRHKIGQIILEVRDAEHKYGAHAVAELATELKRDQATLYRYGRVAQCWSVAALNTILRRTMAGGETLSWSHLSEIASMKNSTARARVLERAIEEGLSVREVASLVRKSERHDSDQSISPLAKLRRFVSVTESLKERATWDVEIAAVDESAEALELIERAVSAQQELQDACARNLSRLRAAHDRLASKLSKPRRSQAANSLISGYGSAS